MKILELDGEHLTIENVAEIAASQCIVTAASLARSKVEKCRRFVEKAIDQGRVIYGVNTGFGKFSDVRIRDDLLERLQENLVMSHAAGVGSPLPADVVRAILLLKANTLLRGYSGCRFEIIERLLALLNKNVLPIIPEKGSVGASGDLAPLAHLALVLIGKGEAICNGQKLNGADALKCAGLERIQLKAKEGLALLNGTQVSTAMSALAISALESLLVHADIIGALSTEALKGTPSAFDQRIHAVRGLKGQIESAQNLRNLLEGSENVASHKDCPKIQDAYSLRCMPQVHGSARDATAFCRSVISAELNSATDNPLIFHDDEVVLSGGNFHAQPISTAADVLAIAAAQLANISERRIEYMLDPATSEMAGFLTEDGGLNSGFMIAQVTAASLVSENKVLCHPASVDSIPTSANKEDFVSMAALAARKALDVVQNAEYVLAIELLCAVQGFDFKNQRSSNALNAIIREIRAEIPHWDQDRIMYHDIETARNIIKSQKLIMIARESLALA
ncbi:histidine ammonia-lyase [candidate division KSB1 bacterium]|nr:histidine ammonia-lyase [candidate division KSB1 bacterium]